MVLSLKGLYAVKDSEWYYCIQIKILFCQGMLHKEFYAMTAEDAYALLESIATISGTLDSPIYWEYNGKSLRDIRHEREEKGLYK